jgi:hypothetical protein
MFSGDPNVDYGSGLGGFGMNQSEYINSSSDGGFIETLSNLSIIDTSNDAQNLVQDSIDNSPGGSNNDSVLSIDQVTADGSSISTGLGFLSTIGQFLYTIPKKMYFAIGNFFQVNPLFITVAFLITGLVVAITIISSILRNRI